MICLYCKTKIILHTNWTNVLYPNSKPRLCHQCENELELLVGKQCEKCSRESQWDICTDCERWQKMSKTDSDPLVKNVSLFKYNTFMKELISNWKYRGDYILGEIFKNIFRDSFHKHFKEISRSAAIVPIPLSDARLVERGFNQATMLASFLTDDISESLARIHSEKQSKKTRMERMSSANPFKLQIPINKRVILVDDIYTTGRTLRHAASILKKNGCTEVYAYTLIRG